jgi:uncharacterized protein
MRIPLTGLKKGPQTYRQRGPASYYLDDAETFSGDIKVEATVKQESGLLLVALEATLEGHFNCDRCGIEFDRPLTMRDDFFFTFDTGHIKDLEPDTAVVPKGALEIDVSQEIRDLIFLGRPIQTLCREDCQGLCPICGANLNEERDHRHEEATDPRWEALKKLKEDK